MPKKTKKTPTEKTDEVESVAKKSAARFKEADDDLREFMKSDENRAVLEEFYALVEERNLALGDAVRDVKAELQRSEQRQLVYDGIGAQKKWSRYYDTAFLNEHLPVKQAELILTPQVTYTLNQPLLEQLLRQGEIDPEVVTQAYHEEAQNPSAMPGTPKEFVLPALPRD